MMNDSAGVSIQVQEPQIQFTAYGTVDIVYGMQIAVPWALILSSLLRILLTQHCRSSEKVMSNPQSME